MNATLRPGVFGEWDAPATDDLEQIPTPVGEQCLWCREEFQEGDNGRISSVGYLELSGHQDARLSAEHRECCLRSVLGGIGHQVDHERFCTRIGDPDAGLGFRRSAILVWEWFNETLMKPNDVQAQRWRQRVDAERSNL